MNKRLLILSTFVISLLVAVAFHFAPTLTESAILAPPATVVNDNQDIANIEKPCSNEHPEWRAAQVIEGVNIAEASACEADNPYTIAAAVKGVNNISMATLMQTDLAQDAITLSDDLDHDGDPDIVHIKLEIVELNGSTPDGEFPVNSFAIAPGIQPGLWVFAPKSRGMAVKNFNSVVAAPMLRAPSPSLRVEQGDQVIVTVENTHYLPHTLHLHGIDHPWHIDGKDNDGTEEHPIFPGTHGSYTFQARHAGTMIYHCHVQTAQHFMMGLSGLFVVEENRPNNWVQTFNIGAGQVRHSSVAINNNYAQEYDLVYQSLDKKLSQIIQRYIDPRLIAQQMTREYNMTESFENYFLLNGHAFPYTLRDSIVAVNDNETIKLRIANLQRSSIAIHFHGHKATITAYDGVTQAPAAQITRDVFDIAPAQRLDLDLNTANNGLNSYGPGLWMFHDHVATGTTTDGMEPGGNMAILAYRSLMDEQGMPKMHEELLTELFNKAYYTKKQVLWNQGDFSKLLGEAGVIAPNYLHIILFGLCAGLALGGVITVFIFINKKKNQ